MGFYESSENNLRQLTSIDVPATSRGSQGTKNKPGRTRANGRNCRAVTPDGAD